MTAGSPADCVLCERASALDAEDPGWLLRTGAWGVSPHPAIAMPGWLAVQTLRHTEGLALLNVVEAAELGPLCVRLSRALAKVTRARQIYTYSLGENCPHTHILIGPPRPDLRGSAFLRAVLRRDEFLADEHEARRVAAELASELAG
jgi:diadenosine tetraphosphate (Ap4A) HIT family hydrolase